MRVVLLHNAVAADAPPDERDVLTQVAAVADALRQLGRQPIPLGCDLDLRSLRSELLGLRPDVVFNLVEALDGADQLMHLPPSLLERWGLPYTGASARAIFLTNDKPLAKQLMLAAGLPTPAWFTPGRHAATPGGGRGIGENLGAGRWIIKAVGDHASLGIDAASVVDAADGAALGAEVAARSAKLGRPCFAEQFIEGREFNLSLLGDGAGPRVLPPAEIDFSAFPPGRPRIVDHNAKWNEHSWEYQQTPRTFEFAASDGPLLRQLAEHAVAAWRLFEMRGYARVDFRVDAQGQPWILEVNANPCLSPDAGFAAAITRAGMAFSEAMACVLQDLNPPMGIPR